MPFCCGKDRETNFCPSCGKAMDMKSGLRGCLAFITGMHERAEKLAKAHEAKLAQYVQGRHGDGYVKDAKAAAERARRKADRFKDWQEALIKAIDGE